MQTVQDENLGSKQSAMTSYSVTWNIHFIICFISHGLAVIICIYRLYWWALAAIMKVDIVSVSM